MEANPSESNPDDQLVRGLGLPQSIALNVSNMVGIGPFVTIPLFIASMHGPQALVAWVIAAVLVICDGLIWCELGAALPGSGGSYHFLREIFGNHSSRLLRMLPFLFVWQFLISGTLEIASAYTGLMPYLTYVFPALEPIFEKTTVSYEFFSITTGSYESFSISYGSSTMAAIISLIVTWMLSRRIEIVGWVGLVLCAGTLFTVFIVIVAGLMNLNASLITFPPDAFKINATWVKGLGGAMLIAIYDYFGYYNICNLGGEVRNPGKTIPRAVIISVVLVAMIYLTMNLAIIAVVPWEQAMKSKQIAALFMETLFGRQVAVIFTWLILWTAIASAFAMTLGYSRIPFAAASNQDFLPIFSRVHPTKKYPSVSLWTLGFLTAVFCFFSLGDVINAAVAVRILVQFIAQILAVHMMRTRRPDIQMPFRMWFYPIPSLIALVGWLFVLGTTEYQLLAIVAAVLVSGVVVYFLFAEKTPKSAIESTNSPT